MRSIFSLIIVFLFFSFPIYGTEGKKVLAILDIEAKSNVREEIAEFVSERIRIEMFKTDSYKIVERQKMNKILEEQKLSLISSTEDENYIRKVGNLLSADEILVGSLSYLEGNYFLNVRIIDVKTGEIVFGDTEKSSSISDLSKSAENVASKISEGNKKSFNKDDNFDTNLDVDFDKVNVKNIVKIVKSVVDYTIKKVESMKTKESENMEITNEKENFIKKEEPQENNKDKDKKSENKFVSFGIGPLFKYHFSMKFRSYNDEWTTINLPFSYGLKGILSFGNVFGIGFAGNIAGSYDKIGDKEYAFGFGYGGITFDFYHKLWNFLRLDLNLLFGWGGANYYVFNSKEYNTPIYEKRNDFFVVEPGIMIGFNIFNAFEIGVTGSYLYRNNKDDFIMINDYNIGIFLIFGLQ